MPHETPLISTIVGGIVLAFVFGAVATRLKASPLVGYLLAGVAIGPFTPGYVADSHLAQELAEIGVILLMFGVGLHFSLKDLMSVRKIAAPGAVVQIAFATLLGVALAYAMGWGLQAGIVFGLALSVASTVVLLRALQERRLIQTERGRIAVGWLIVEDLAMILALVLLPSWAQIQKDVAASGGFGPDQIKAIGITLVITLGKVAAFIALMLIVGRRVIPWLLHRVVHTGSREMFRLAVLAIALGVAYGAAELFGVSFALGAFFAGMMMGESELSHQAANETLPLRDAFAVLFFVSVGMLFNPMVLIENPWPLLATLGIIVIGKSIAALAIMALFRQNMRSSILIAASLAQIGEFSFILAAMGVQLGLLPEAGRDLILAGAILSIVLNPLVFLISDRWRGDKAKAPVPAPAITPKKGRAIVVGYGRVGSVVGTALKAANADFLVIEDQQEVVDKLTAQGVSAIAGNAISPDVAKEANLAGADWLFITVPDGFEAGRIVEMARAANPKLNILARAHSDAEAEHLKAFGADLIVMGEREIARSMIAGARALIPPVAADTAA
ncbi:MAG: sodium:proton antiporter [Caulobacterales bacterium 68-7]|nr:MAG: sodium:proton antiporter [Caulobacterales bacterium 68-7]